MKKNPPPTFVLPFCTPRGTLLGQKGKFARRRGAGTTSQMPLLVMPRDQANNGLEKDLRPARCARRSRPLSLIRWAVMIHRITATLFVIGTGHHIIIFEGGMLWRNLSQSSCW